MKKSKEEGTREAIEDKEEDWSEKEEGTDKGHYARGDMRVPLLLSLLLSLLLLSTKAQDLDRIDCFPEPNSYQQACEDRGCIWTAATSSDPPNMPYCYMNAVEIGYTAATDGTNSWRLTKNNGPKNPWGDDIQTAKFSYSDVGNGVINIRIEDYSNARYEPSAYVTLPRDTLPTTEKLSVVVDDQSDPFSFSVQRSNGLKLIDTSIGGLIFSDKFIQIATRLPTKHMYGWGEAIHQNIVHDFTRYTTWPMFARDQPPSSQGLVTNNLYGVHPFYMIMESGGKAHGVFFFNSNAQEVSTIPEPALVYKTIGGIIDMYVFPGPSPKDVIAQYHAFISKPFLPAYWGLGYQLCRYGYLSLDDMKNRVAAVRSYNIPFDVAYADIDYMNRYKDFTTGDAWSGFGDYVKQMHDWGMHNILIFDPAVEVDYDSFQRGLDAGAQFIEWERDDQVQNSINDLYPMAKGTKVQLGVVWPDNNVAFPDFLDPTNKTDAWWQNEFKLYHDQIPFDGAWIDMNEPSVFGTNDDHPWYFDNSDHPNTPQLRCPTSGDDAEYDMPPYKTFAVWNYGTSAYLATNTLCMHAMTAGRQNRLYNTKNLYGWSETRSTQQAVGAVTGKRGVVITRSTFPSSGKYGGHWLGDNTATWQDLRTAVIGVMEFNMFGINYVGSDVCGFNGVTTEELCLRWQQLGSFHSFFRNHNSIGLPYQDPAVWPSVAAASKKANEFRYTLLPYLYSLHYLASLNGGTVIRPLFFEYPEDAETYTISEQFMWGPSFIVAPSLYESQTTVEAYIPAGDPYFSVYDSNYGQKVSVGLSTFPCPATYNTPTFVRGGSIIPRQPSNITTVASRLSNFNLLIVPNTDNTASGVLYWDDGDSVVTDIKTNPVTTTSFSYSVSGTTSTLTIAVSSSSGPTQPPLDYFEVFNVASAPNYASFTLNGKALSVNTQTSKYSALSKTLTVYFTKAFDISTGTNTITWSSGATLLRTNRTSD